MVKKCCIKACKSESYSGCGISFHSFPTKQEMKQRWLDVIPVSQNITKNSVVCSLHFMPEDFYEANSRRMLKSNAVPFVFPLPKEDSTNYHKCKLMNQEPRLKPTASLRNIVQSSETQEPQTFKTNKSSRTRTITRSNKQSAVSTPKKLSDKDGKIPEVTQESQSLETNNTSTGLYDTKKCRKKQTADVKLPEVTQESQSSEANITRSGPSGASNTNKRGKTRTADDKLPEVTQESQSLEANSTSSHISGLCDTKKRRKKQTADVKLPEAEELIASVYKFLQAEYEFLKCYIGDICDLSPLTNVLKRTADACGVCKYTVRRIVDKTRSEGDQNVAGPAKRAKLQQQVLQVSSLADEESSCDESEKDENEEEEQDIKEMEDDSKVEESSCSDSDDELEDEERQLDDDSEECDECEVEAPNMDINDDEVQPLDPLKTEPIEIMTESTDVGNTQSSSDVVPMTSPAPVKTEPDDNCTDRCSWR